ncbi:MAG: hypothetical protein NTX65_04260 [Ignavibacteriales bacterium]|nr:hypothetical protein [Ignavibacteriales bacterium]
MKKYLSALVCGFGAGVLLIVPFLRSFSCCFIIPLAAFVSLMLDQRATNSREKIGSKRAIMFGIVTGLYAALFGSFFEVFITLITKNNDIIATFPELQRMINSFAVSPEIKTEVLKLFQNVREEILTKGFSVLYTFSVLINNFIVNTIFGAVGGLVGAQIINNKLNNTTS